MIFSRRRERYCIFEKNAMGPAFAHTKGDRVLLTPEQIVALGDAVKVDRNQKRRKGVMVDPEDAVLLSRASVAREDRRVGDL